MNFNPYLVFDVPMNADFDTLRATYRRLARENHPDIADDKSLATERMAQINRAWGILGDHTKRAAFDSQWQRHLAEQAHHELLRREAAQREMARARARRAPVSNSQPAPRTYNAAQNLAYSASRSSKKSKRSAGAKLRAQLAGKPAPRGSAPAKTRLDAALFNEAASPQALRLMRKITLAARLFHRDGNAKGAIETCRAVLLSDNRNVPARELLSEIFASQGRLEIAVMMLDQAIQIAPDDLFLRRRRDHLESARFPGGTLRAIKRPSLWQRLSARFKKRR